MHIYLVRHGETDACHISDKNNKNVCLNRRGKEQITKLLSFLPYPTVVMASPTIRTLESAHILARGKNVATETRLWNKSDDYETNLLSLLHDLQTQRDDQDIIILVTHGRIIKMIYSLITYQSIKKEIMDDLVLDYGDVFSLEMQSGKYIMSWNIVKNDNV